MLARPSSYIATTRALARAVDVLLAALADYPADGARPSAEAAEVTRALQALAAALAGVPAARS